MEAVVRKAKEAGAFDAIMCHNWEHGGAGATDLATALEKATDHPSDFKFLYDLEVMA